MKSQKAIIWILALILLVTSVQGALTDGLPFYHKFDNATTTSSLSIDSLYAHNFTNHGAVLNITGKILQAWDYESGDTTDYATMPSSPTIEGLSSFTIAMWIKPESLTADWYGGTLANKYRGDNVEGDYGMRIGSTNLSCFSRVGTTEYYSQGLSTFSPGNWYFVACVYNGTHLVPFVSGVKDIPNPKTMSGTVADNNGVLLLGNLQAGGNRPFDGIIDEVGFWNRSLSASELLQLYNSDTGLSYPFGGAPTPTTDVDFTITDQWNSSSISSFIINVSWSNGTTTQHSTNNGTVSLSNITAGAINVTYYNMTDYFNMTISDTLTENISNSVSTTTFQAVLCLNASAKVSGAYITADNFTIGTSTHAECFNITAGTHNVQAQKTGWYSQNQTVSVTALSNATQTIQNLSYANLTIYAIDGNTNTSLSGYDLTILSINHSGWTGESPTGITNHSFYLINGTYNVTITMPGYAVTETQANITVSGGTNYTFTLYQSNSVSITILDEITNNPIYDNITIRWSDNATTWENVTNTSTLFIHNISVGNYTLLFYSSNYSTRTYSITVGPASHQFLTAYMISSTYSTIFTIKDIDTRTILDGVAITMYKLINSTWTTVESKVSDISGKAQFYYDPIANYRFYLSSTGYEDYIFFLNPILFSTYDAYMTKESVLNYSVDFDDISFIYSPTTFNNNANVTMNFLISSPGGMLTDYGIKVTYPGGNDTASGVNAIGEQMSVDVNITNATAYDYVVLEFNYTTSLSGTRTYVFNLPINMNVTGGTWMSNKDKTYGLGIFERMLIATIIIIFVVGIATMVGQAIPGVALGMFVYGFLVFIGFVPLWAILPSMLIGVMFLIWKSGGY